MQYEVRCNNCGHYYHIEGQESNVVNSYCPKCGCPIKVSLPLVSSKNCKIEKTSEVSKAIRAALIVIIVGLVLGGGGYWLFLQHQEKEQLSQLQDMRIAKAHQDSLMYVRAQQEAAEQAQSRREERQQYVKAFLHQFYEDGMFGGGNLDNYREDLTETCFQKLKLAAMNTGSNEGELAWWELNPYPQESEEEKVAIGDFRIQPQGDDWYDVSLIVNGTTYTKQVKALLHEGHVLIDDYR